MLDERDIQLLREVVREESRTVVKEEIERSRAQTMTEVKEEIERSRAQTMTELKEEIERSREQTMVDVKEEIARSRSQMFAYIESAIMPKLDALAEGHATLLETLAPKTRVDALEDEVVLLKQVIRALSQDVAELKKAQ